DEDANFYGLQATIAREVFLTGECFVRLHYVDLYGRSGVPLQLQVYPTEMLVACQRVLYILTLGFVPIYFFQKIFKGFSKGLQRLFKDPLMHLFSSS
ncbi:hypothetical protein, partial [Bartonella taylorii]|uniref:hypothetical protein n=1 Tax=Bartonella taylorii TaxID=33046 RepID=UPI001ABBA102